MKPPHKELIFSLKKIFQTFEPKVAEFYISNFLQGVWYMKSYPMIVLDRYHVCVCSTKKEKTSSSQWEVFPRA